MLAEGSGGPAVTLKPVGAFTTVPTHRVAESSSQFGNKAIKFGCLSRKNAEILGNVYSHLSKS